MKKIILLLTLLVPAAIFIFLKIFGKNEFAIPVYYENGVENPPNACNNAYAIPYLVSPDALQGIGWKQQAALIMKDSSVYALSAMKMLSAELDDEIQLILARGETGRQMVECDLLLADPWKVVLMDSQRKIRGYYDPTTREEADRLMVELKILLMKY